MSKTRQQILHFTLLVCSVAALVVAARFLPIAEALRVLQERAGQGGWRSAIGYALLFAACNVLLLPGGILSVGAGALFGVWRGFGIVLVGNTLGALIAFGIGRTFGRPVIRRIVSRNSRVRALEPAVEREGWKIILLSQLHPLFPTSLLVYLYALTKVRFSSCMLLVALGRAPGLLLYAYIGAVGSARLGEAVQSRVEIYQWLIITIASIGVIILVMRLINKMTKANPDLSSTAREH
ncbi:MAG: TVP38/TMEM64 family protein [Verrucomicrobiota bacterium]|nr:TVP38/TMEM64 family protein [Verrucomicrobiota bacterium]